MRIRTVTIAMVAALALAGCGKRGALEPVADKPAPTPYGATATPAADAVMTAPTQARPTRSDEVLRDGEQRRSDPFDLPPQN